MMDSPSSRRIDKYNAPQVARQLEQDVNAGTQLIDRFLQGGDGGAGLDKRYEVGHLIAHGGVGAVFSSRDMNIHRDVAFKVLQAGAEANEEQVLRFVHEAQITGQLEHPNIVPVHELGVSSAGTVYYTMKLIGGMTLKEILSGIVQGDRKLIKRFHLGALLTIFQKACDALAFAHSRNVLHRDLKPDNIMVGEFGEVIVLDWGLAKVLNEGMPEEITDDSQVAGVDPMVTAEGKVMGTPAYMAPEQAVKRFGPVDQRADVYAMGCILYSILTLSVPVHSEDVTVLMTLKARGEIDPPSTFNPDGTNAKVLPHCPNRRIPGALSAVTMRALSPRKQDRYQSIADLQADIQAYQGGFATAAEGASPLRVFFLLLRRRWREALILTGSLGIIVALAGAFGYNEVRTARETRRLYNDLLRATRETARVRRQAAPEFMSKAERLIEEQKWDEALKSLEIAQSLNKRLVDTRILRARILLADEKFDEVVELLEATNKDRIGSPYDRRYAPYLLLARKYAQKRAADGRTLSPMNRLAFAKELRAFQDLPAAEKVYLRSRTMSLANGDSMMAVRTAIHFAEMKNPKAKRISYVPELKDGILSLDLSGNRYLTDLNPFEGLPLTHLSLQNCSRLDDIAALKGMPLVRLDISRTAVSSIDALRDSKLVDLDISHTKVNSLASLQKLPLRRLTMDWCHHVRHFRDLKGLKLEHLQANYARNISDVEPLKGMTSLTYLDLQKTQVIDVAPLHGLKLTHLDLGSIYIDNISPLKGLPLKYLNLEFNPVTKLDALQGAPLEELNLASTDIVDLEPLKGMMIKKLNLSNCEKLKSVGVLRTCTKLKSVLVPRQANHIGYLKALPDLKYLSYDNSVQSAASFWKEYKK